MGEWFDNERMSCIRWVWGVCGLCGIDRFAGRPISVDWRMEKELIRDSVFARRAG